MNTKIKKVEIDGEVYVPLSEVNQYEMAPKVDGMEYCMVRTYSAGVFAGYVESRDGKEITLRNARRIWYWSGAASLSELAMRGTSCPDNCKFPCPVDKVILTEVIEIIPITEQARESIEGVPVWSE